ncbi:hypothetical protein ACFX12_040058 [Malus domestica]
MYMYWKSCTRSCTNVSITLLAKDKFESNPVTRAYVGWWSKVIKTRDCLLNIRILLKKLVTKLICTKMNLFCDSVNKF